MKGLLGMKAASFEGQLRRKRRRNSSATKQNTSSIYFATEQNKKIQLLLTENKDTEIVFSDRVLRLDKNMKLVNYQLIITTKQFYLFKDKSGKFKESGLFKNIESICLSHQSDNFMLIKIKGSKKSQDVLICSRRKIQISQVLVQQTQKETSQFPLTITDKFYFNHQTKAGQERFMIVFSRIEPFGVQTNIYPDKPKDDQKKKKKKV
ncbi:hypothetical protein TRFO_10151 [Tritrichomonas foetus]|uniref:TH1 domain-containing protein n=1 Tax=Tritrichomonas foetus TaxID=1144522 RepID=A0A1J4JAL1_9EUKA|nr:hypothetical protein TRFO_10151 [Tritrichomonas foetus]|eukprot:OHS96206.1 hypothetical protein TRFO_10151 [Tritrichomonas foetus]